MSPVGNHDQSRPPSPLAGVANARYDGIDDLEVVDEAVRSTHVGHFVVRIEEIAARAGDDDALR